MPGLNHALGRNPIRVRKGLAMARICIGVPPFTMCFEANMANFWQYVRHVAYKWPAHIRIETPTQEATATDRQIVKGRFWLAPPQTFSLLLFVVSIDEKRLWPQEPK